MNGRRVYALALAGFLLLAAQAALADLKEIAPGVFFDDFESGALGQLAVDEKEQRVDARLPQALEVVREAGRAVLHLKGGGFHTRVFYPRRFGDFVLRVRMKKTAGSYAGVVVRDHWRVYLQMRCFLSLNSDAKGWQSKGELVKSDTMFPGYHDVTVICAGPLLHAFVDGRRIFTYRIGPGEGRIGFYAHGNGEAYYDDIRVQTDVAPHYYVLVEPVAHDDCLVFSPRENVALRFDVSNYHSSAQAVNVAAAVLTWDGEVVKPQTEREVLVQPGATRPLVFDIGRVAAGFYRVTVRASCGGREVCNIEDLPLAVHERGTVRFKPPALPIGVYYKYYNLRSPLYANTYAHAAAQSLREHHFNCVVSDPSFTEEIIAIFQSYGIATIARGEKFLEHPAVIAAMVSDEPKPDEIDKLKQEYERLEKQTDKPITTCLVGDALGLGRDGGPLWMWKRLQPRLRCFRWYGIKKSFYDILHEVKYKPYLPLSSVLRIAEFCSDTPYWFVAQAFGKTEHESYFHKPTPAEIRGMMHLALAYGADGILLWAFQSHGSLHCLVDQKSLAPTDGNYFAAAEVAAKVAAHAELISSLVHGGLDVRCPSPVVDAVPRQGAKEGKLYVYVVNKDTKNAVSTRLLLWAERWTLSSVRDVFSGRNFPVSRDAEGYLSVPFTLEPGEGMLLATDARPRSSK